jgi:hypothetical protein
MVASKQAANLPRMLEKRARRAEVPSTAGETLLLSGEKAGSVSSR